MKVFRHHLYEYRKGLRNLVLHTLPGIRRKCVEAKLASEGIDYVIQELPSGSFNVFFGADECVAVVREIGRQSLSKYTAEEDFILGTMLGYGRLQQCIRYIKMRSNRSDRTLLTRGSLSEELEEEVFLTFVDEGSDKKRAAYTSGKTPSNKRDSLGNQPAAIHNIRAFMT